ncbi:PTI1-like tyrosine-protein kinase 3 [Phragmites australis]|uniref:PTI1-like tyrosine-protein kinase 3 n=1 Tax=Phragmites australis TaxID=29695 RepID=UPI002D77F643|nr:PTI1-like tyrosine-protein kinase 3 [Phragmites australis]
MGWWESAKAMFGDSGNLGCFPRIGRKQSKNSYAYPADPEKRSEPGGPAAEEVVTVEVPEVPLRELNEITGSFSGEKLIGQGSYAKVYRVTLRSGRPAVVKRLEKPSKRATNVVFLKQLSAASRLKHENFVRLLGYTISGDLRVLVYEFATMGTLHDVLHGDRGVLVREPEQPSIGRPVLSWAHRVQIALDAARGLEYLHEMVRPAVTHKDVRSTNVLIFEGFRAKIADYNMFSQAADMARLNRSTHTLGSFGYQAPEYAMMGQMTDKSDVYSFGIVLLELLTGRKPLDRTLPQGQRSLVNWATPILTEDRVQECIDPSLGDEYPPAGALKLSRIAVQCLQYDPAFRPSMGTVARVINYAVLRDQQGVV